MVKVLALVRTEIMWRSLFWLWLPFLWATERLRASIRHQANINYAMMPLIWKNLAPFKNQNIHACWNTVFKASTCSGLFRSHFTNIQRQMLSWTNVYSDKKIYEACLSAMMGWIQVKSLFKPFLNIPVTEDVTSKQTKKRRIFGAFRQLRWYQCEDCIFGVSQSFTQWRMFHSPFLFRPQWWLLTFSFVSHCWNEERHG